MATAAPPAHVHAASAALVRYLAARRARALDNLPPDMAEEQDAADRLADAQDAGDVDANGNWIEYDRSDRSV